MRSVPLLALGIPGQPRRSLAAPSITTRDELHPPGRLWQGRHVGPSGILGRARFSPSGRVPGLRLLHEPAVELDVAVDDDAERELARRSAAGPRRRAPSLEPGSRSRPIRADDQAAAVGSGTSTPVRPSSIRSVLPPMPETTQGRAVAIASRSELLIPSATLGRTKTSAARR